MALIMPPRLRIWAVVKSYVCRPPSVAPNRRNTHWVVTRNNAAIRGAATHPKVCLILRANNARLGAADLEVRYGAVPHRSTLEALRYPLLIT
jgi:hypothetical protein